MSPPMTIFKRINYYISKEIGGFTHEDQVVRSHIPQLGFLGGYISRTYCACNAMLIAPK